MRKLVLLLSLVALLAVPAMVNAYPTVYPHGTTVYKPEKAWSGYTIFTIQTTAEGDQGTMLIDMNGNVVKNWKNVGVMEHPSKLLKGGFVMGATGAPGRIQDEKDSNDVSIVDWDGNIKWSRKNAGMHHDFQREGNPVGYYAPGMDSKLDSGDTMILVNRIVNDKKVSDKPLMDDSIIIVGQDGKTKWEWSTHDHIDEMNFSIEARNTMYRYPNMVGSRNPGKIGGDWYHANSASWVGPNKWFDAGDQRFHPENIIIDGRQVNSTHIIDYKTGKIVWSLGPDYQSTAALRKIGVTVGLHHSHIIPKGLPGEGNVLIFDNGGFAGFGAPNDVAPWGINNTHRAHSRILEIDPVKMTVVWEYTANTSGYRDLSKFFSDYVSSSQRLPNGNTLICEGSVGRLFEVTKEGEIVWEYISPYYYPKENFNMVYRAYRAPYDYVPQLTKPVEKAVVMPPAHKLRVSDLTVAK